MNVCTILCIHVCVSACIHIYCMHVEKSMNMYEYMYVCIYKCRHLGMYVDRHTRVCICMYGYECICACVYIKSLLPCHYTHSWHSLNKYGYSIANVSQTTIMCNVHTDPTFLHTYAKAQPTVLYTSHYRNVHTNNKNAPQMPHICKLVHVQWEDTMWVNVSYELPAITMCPGALVYLYFTA